ncbi:N-acetylmuramoyl-L-alanine amidase [Eggerthia catenaformis]|uniref:N-acetylmuramoyl-L-alanine amidase n=1 Tax=Eggerthia catenaformis TaxID=31973 RepID=UPI0028E517AD|nr:N-acetylmuramoyl-L-alanine amidase [Eggerthia catenaformis]
MKKSHKLAALLITGTLLFGCSSVKKNKQDNQPVAETKKETEKKEDSRKEDTKKQEQENISPEKKKQEDIKKTEQKKTISQKTQPINNTKKEKKKTENTPKNKIIPNNKVVCIDPGHQAKGNLEKEPIGPGAKEYKAKVTYGATGNYTHKTESQLNLEVGLKLKSVLESRGYKVVMVRTSQNVNISNKERADIANNAHAGAFIRLHADSSTNHNTHGATGLAPKNNNPYLTSSVISGSQRLTRNVLNSMCKRTGAKNRGISYVNNMSGINWCKVPVALIEMGFMSNKTEDYLLSDSTYQYKIANGIADGIDAFLK